MRIKSDPNQLKNSKNQNQKKDKDDKNEVKFPNHILIKMFKGFCAKHSF